VKTFLSYCVLFYLSRAALLKKRDNPVSGLLKISEFLPTRGRPVFQLYFPMLTTSQRQGDSKKETSFISNKLFSPERPCSEAKDITNKKIKREIYRSKSKFRINTMSSTTTYRPYHRSSSGSSSENLPPRTLARVAREIRDLHKNPPEGVRLVVDGQSGMPSSLGEVVVSGRSCRILENATPSSSDVFLKF
jgi:hypothetical protein